MDYCGATGPASDQAVELDPRGRDAGPTRERDEMGPGEVRLDERVSNAARK